MRSPRLTTLGLSVALLGLLAHLALAGPADNVSSLVRQGTVITVAQYAAQLDAQGNPVKDPNGRFVKTSNIVGYTVMEKRAGWGTDYPEAQRNGEWEYQAFRADKTANPNANLTACFNCHKPQAGQDFVFSYQSMKSAAR